MSSNRWDRFLTGLFAALILTVMAGNSFAQDINIHGFVSQGYIQSSANQFLVQSTEGSYEFNEFAINATANPVPKLRVGAQFLGRDLGTVGNNIVAIDWAFGDYRWRDWLGVRVGKIKQAHGLYNTGRDVDLLRTSIFLPQSVYYEEGRELMLSYSGIDLYGTRNIGPLGRLSYEAFVGTKSVSDASQGWFGIIDYKTASAIVDAIPGIVSAQSGGLLPASAVSSTLTDLTDEKTRFHNITGGSLIWNTPVSGLRLGVSSFMGEINEQYKASIQTSYPTGDPSNPTMTTNQTSDMRTDIHVENVSVYSAEYKIKNLTLSTELMNIGVSLDQYLDGQQVSKDGYTHQEGYYGMADYKVNPLFSVAAAYSVFYNNIDDAKGDHRPTGWGTPDNWESWYAWQKDLSLSTRFNLNSNWTVKFEGHSMNGIAQLDPRVNPQNDLKENWYVFAFKTTYHF